MEEQLVVFKLGQEDYAVPIGQVREIIVYQTATKLPNSTDYLEGIINIRGNIIPVINLNEKLGIAKDTSQESNIVIMDINGQHIGMVVDEVSEVVRIEESNIEHPGLVGPHKADFVRGIAKIDQRMFILIDLDKVLCA